MCCMRVSAVVASLPRVMNFRLPGPKENIPR